jgi:addiction module RelB/DinJ family antitoxin
MSQLTRTATIQARVFPPVKEASEQILWRLGLTMSEAVEIFLRKIIVEERIPFEIVALDIAQLSDTGEASAAPGAKRELTAGVSEPRPGGGAPKENSKSFSRGVTSRNISRRKSRKKGQL